MSEHYNFPAQDYSVFGNWTGGLTSEERRELTGQNLAMSNAKRKKKKPSKPAERKLTEPERRAKEQARIRKERQERSALSEANRREAGIGQPSPAPEPAPQQSAQPEPQPPEQQKEPKETKPEKKPERKSEKKSRSAATPTDISEINIDVPTEPVPPPEPEKKPEPETKQAKQKKEKKKKRSSKPEKIKTESRTDRAKRYNRSSSNSSSASRRYQSRITTGGAVTLGLLTGLLIGTVIYGRVQTNEIYTVINAKQAEYDDLISRNVSMKSEMEGKMTVKNIEEYAENELGLMPLDQSQIVYLQILTEDEVNITEPEENLFVTVNDYLVGIWEYLRGK